MDKKKVLIVIPLLVLATASCDAQTNDNRSDGKISQQTETNQTRHEKRPRKNSDHRRPLKNFAAQIPPGMPEYIAFHVVVTSARDSLLENIKVEITFNGENQFGEPLQQGQLLDKPYYFSKKTDCAGVAKFSLPSMSCYNFTADIKVSKPDCHSGEAINVLIHEGTGPQVIKIWTKEEWKRINGDCN